MATRSPQVEANGYVTVSLADVSKSMRVEAAWKLIRKHGLDTYAAIELSLAAEEPLENPSISVPVAKARRVLEEGKFPIGPWPVFE